jgi:hypothetical protein
MASRMTAASPSEPEGQQVYCWACHALVVVPLMPDGNVAQVFKVCTKCSGPGITPLQGM